MAEGERRVFEKTNSLESKLEGSDAELHATMENFEHTVRARAGELRQMQQKADGLTQEIRDLRAQTEQLNAKKGQATLLQEQARKLRDEQVNLSRTLQRKFNLPLPASNWTTAAARDYAQHLNNEVSLMAIGRFMFCSTVADRLNASIFQFKRLEKECNDSIAQARRAVDSHDKDVNKTRANMDKLDVELTLKNDEYHAVMRESDQKRAELSRLASSRNAIQQNQMDFEDAQRQHDEFAQSYAVKSNEYKKQIRVSVFVSLLLCFASLLSHVK